MNEGRSEGERVGEQIVKFVAASAALVLLLVSGCGSGESPKKVSLETREATEVPGPAEKNALRFAVGAMLVPREGFQYYRQLLKYLGDEIGRPVKVVDRESYAEVNALLEEGELDAAFVCSGPYVDGHDLLASNSWRCPWPLGSPFTTPTSLCPERVPSLPWKN
jgi:phosphonate transport system substrate-binding protein